MASAPITDEQVTVFAKMIQGLDIADTEARREAIAKLSARLLIVFLESDKEAKEKLLLAFDFNNPQAAEKLEHLKSK